MSFVLAAGAVVLATGLPAAAHTPVSLDCHDVVPMTSPLGIDGLDPLLFFGSLPTARSVRSFQLHLHAGDALNVGVGVPDEAPENAVATSALPKVLVIAPNGKVTRYDPTLRIPLYADETDQNYLILSQASGTAAVGGTYSFIVFGGATERFFVATGVEGGPFHGVLRGSEASIDEINAWYATPPSPTDCRR